jgi:hypothetical protein
MDMVVLGVGAAATPEKTIERVTKIEESCMIVTSENEVRIGRVQGDEEKSCEVESAKKI